VPASELQSPCKISFKRVGGEVHIPLLPIGVPVLSSMGGVVSTSRSLVNLAAVSAA